MSRDPTTWESFRIAEGGPFYELQKRLQLVHERASRAPARALFWITITWCIPLAISAGEGTIWSAGGGLGFLRDPVVWTRFLIAIACYLLMEKAVEHRLQDVLSHFVRVPMLTQSSLPEAAAAVDRALKRKDAALPELVCGILAAGITVSGMTYRLQTSTVSTWAVTHDASGNALTLAGWYIFLISNPVFVFLLFRWLWRLQIWSQLLRSLARVDLRLVATHPDNCGGLGFLTTYPNAYTLFVFATSCVVGAAMAKELQTTEIEMKVYAVLIGIWLALVLVIFTYPLLAFRGPLQRLKTETLRRARVHATAFLRHTERDVLGANIAAPEPDTDGDAPKDPGSLYEAANKLRTLLLRRDALIPISVAAVLPLIASGASEWPVKEILQVAKRLLLL